ncbi:MAG TPA: hypothetical protein VLM79_25235 [Kofleriaceae bacterium]|nr:hypothetical protein [Kofleriaceae bacterium]
MTDAFEAVLDLSTVRGGFDAGNCADDVWPWAAGGAMTGGRNPVMRTLGFVPGAGAASLASPNCGENGKSPATMLREGLTPGVGRVWKAAGIEPPRTARDADFAVARTTEFAPARDAASVAPCRLPQRDAVFHSAMPSSIARDAAFRSAMPLPRGAARRRRDVVLWRRCGDLESRIDVQRHIIVNAET